MLAEFLGAGFLLIAVVGSGIMAETLADGNTALALLANAIATGLLLIIFGGLAQNSKAIASMVALYITGAYWFTASTSFANPAVSIARALSDTFAGIYPAHVPMFILCQLIGMTLALVAVRAIYDRQTSG